MNTIANRRAVATSGTDFYPTPPWATRALILQETFTGTILEPCCGNGAMVEELQHAGLGVTASDLYDHGYGSTGIDARSLIGTIENVVTNPPYNIAHEILMHFLPIVERKIALLLRLSFLESRRRFPLFSASPPSRVYIFSERLSLAPAGKKLNGGGTVSYGWFVWERGNNASPELRWIPPGLKNQ